MILWSYVSDRLSVPFQIGYHRSIQHMYFKTGLGSVEKSNVVGTIWTPYLSLIRLNTSPLPQLKLISGSLSVAVQSSAAAAGSTRHSW